MTGGGATSIADPGGEAGRYLSLLGPGMFATMRMSWLPLLAVPLLLTGCGPRVSGLYLARLPDGVAAFQLVVDGAGALGGSVEVVEYDPDGNLSDRTDALSGEASAGHVALTIGASGPFAASGHYTGTVAGNVLTLDGTDSAGRRLHLEARRGSESSLKAATRKITADAAAQRQAASRAATERALQQLALNATAYADGADDVVARLGQTQAAAHLLTARMAAAAQRAASQGAAAAERFAALLPLADAGAQADADLRFNLARAESQTAAIDTALAQAARICRSAETAPPAPASTLKDNTVKGDSALKGGGTLKADCMTIASVVPGFGAAKARIGTAFAAAAAAWQQALADQSRLLTQARGGN